MPDDLIVQPHAFKHGITERDIRHAFENAYASRPRKGPYPPQYISIGPDTHGRDVQVVSVWNADERAWVVFHAMPATRKALRELGLL